MNPQDYDRTIIAFSGGKDSLACLLWALENGCKNIELWHHCVDGREGSALMDWASTEGYCRAVAQAFNVPIAFSWLNGGFEREMNRMNQKKAATSFETPAGEIVTVGGKAGKEATRRRFPQKTADLKTRWCSAYLKVDVCAIAINNQPRFNNSKTLLITGERAEESAARAKYAELEPDRTDRRDSPKLRRHVDRFRPIHGWEESQVWQIIERHRVLPHPAYRLGWGRLSCMACIFGSADQWSTIRAIAPQKFEAIAAYEDQFQTTIDRKRLSVREVADKGTPYQAALEQPELVRIALSEDYREAVIVDDWQLPAGAYGDSSGPI